MLKWTVQQKRHRAAAATADGEPDERDSGSADGCSSVGGSRSSSRSNSGDCDGEEQQQQVPRAPDGSAAGCDCSGPTTESAADQRWASDRRETEPRLLSTADAGYADEDTAADSSAAATASFVRRPSIRQPRGRSARPLSLNLETFYACDRAAIPQKAKALLGIDERPRTPIVAAVSAVGQLDGLSMSPKALAVLGITAAEQQSQQQQQQMVQQLHHRQRKSQVRRRSPAGGSLQQINEGSPVCDGPDASSSSNPSTAAASGGVANGRTASADGNPAARRDVGSRDDSRRDAIDGLSPDCDAGRCGMYDGRTAVTAATSSAVRDADRNIRVVYGSPRTTICHLPRQQQQQQRGEHLNEAVEVVAARPKVARRRPLKHSRRESPTNGHGLTVASVVEPDDDSSSSSSGGSSSSSSRGGGGGVVPCDGSALDRSLQVPHGRCGSCTPDSGVGGVQRTCGLASAETDSLSDYDDDDDAVAAWRQPHPLPTPPPPSVGSCACGERRAMPTTPPAAATMRVAVSGTSPPLPPARSSPPAPPAASPPPGAQSDFIDVDVRARPLPLARLPSAAAVACLNHRAPSDRKPRTTRCDGRLTPEAFCSSSDAGRRTYLLPPQHMLQPQYQLRTVTRAPSPVCGGRISPSLGLRHAHSDPVSSSWMRTAGDALQTCMHEPESARWAAVKVAGGSRNERGYNNQQHDRAAERQAAMAAYRKTVHVYC